MSKKLRVNPVALKGKELLARAIELMGPMVNESKHSNAVLEHMKLGADNNVYGIVRENHNHYIKIAENKPNLTVKDFGYVGGLQNITERRYPTYSQALKQLNLKLLSLNEAYGVEARINTFESDETIYEEDVIDESDETPEVEEIEEEIELSEEEKAIEDMLNESKKPTFKKGLSVARSIATIDEVIDDITRKKKVYRID